MPLGLYLRALLPGPVHLQFLRHHPGRAPESGGMERLHRHLEACGRLLGRPKVEESEAYSAEIAAGTSNKIGPVKLQPMDCC